MLPNLSSLSLRRQCLAVGAPLSDEVKAAMGNIECNICLELLSTTSPYWLGNENDDGAKGWTIACFNQHVFHKACLKGAWEGAGRGRERCPDCREKPAPGLVARSTMWRMGASTAVPDLPPPRTFEPRQQYVVEMLDRVVADDPTPPPLPPPPPPGPPRPPLAVPPGNLGMQVRVNPIIEAGGRSPLALWKVPRTEELGDQNLKPPLPEDTRRVFGEVEVHLQTMRNMLDDTPGVNVLVLGARSTEIAIIQVSVLSNRINYISFGFMIHILHQYVTGMQAMMDAENEDEGDPRVRASQEAMLDVIKRIISAYEGLARRAGLSWDAEEGHYRLNDMARLPDGSPFVRPAGANVPPPQVDDDVPDVTDVTDVTGTFGGLLGHMAGTYA